MLSETDSGPVTRFLELRIPPVVVFGVFALVMWLIATRFPVFDVIIPFRLALTVFLMGTAIITGTYSFYLLNQVKITVHPNNSTKSSQLVTTGPFKHTRNPMYLALSLILISWGIFLSDLLALMLMPAYYAYMTRLQIIPEERELCAGFGEDYKDYADRTPRWL